MKRLIHILLVCTLLLSLVQIPHAYAASTEFPLLEDLRIIKASPELDEQLSLDDLARMAVMLHSNGTASENQDFVQTAKDYGLIDDSVRAPISLNTAASVLINSVYWRLCQDKTEKEIVDFGSLHGLFKSVRIVNSSAISLGEAAGLAKNILDMDSVVYDGDSYRLDSKTVLEENFEITKQDGILYTGKMRGFTEKHVTVGNDVYETDKDYTEYGGYMVRAYVKEDQLISVDTQKFKNEIYVVSANDIDSITSDSITFFRARDSKLRQTIAADAKEIYNGRLVDYNYTDMDISNGYIKLIKHPGKSSYNVVVIDQYDLMVAGGAGGNMIYGLEGSGINIKLDPSTIDARITLEGEEASLASIQKYDVLMLSYTQAKDAVDIEIVRNVASGELVEWGRDTIKVGRKTYVKTAYFKKHAKQTELGSEIELLLDKSGLAVDIKHVDDETRYGYFMGMYKSADDETYNIRVLTDEGTSELIDLKDRVVLNGKSIKPDDSESGDLVRTFRTLITMATDGTKTERVVNDYVYQVIIYKLDSSGKINYIDTAIQEEYEDEEDHLKLESYIDKNIKYKSNSAQFIDNFGMTGDVTKIFRVPVTDNVFDASGNLDEEKRGLANRNKHYELAAPGIIKNDTKVKISAYNITRGGIAKVAVLYNEDLEAQASFRDTSKNPFVVTEIMQGRSPEGDECYILDGLENAVKKRYYIKNEDYGRKENNSDDIIYPHVHDIMQIQADSDGIVLNYTTRYCYQDKKCYYERTYDEAEFGCISGYVTDKDENGFKLMSDLGTKTKERTVMNKGITYWYVYDVAAKTMRSGSIVDLIAKADSRYNPSQIFGTSTYGEVRRVIIYVDEEE